MLNHNPSLPIFPFQKCPQKYNPWAKTLNRLIEVRDSAQVFLYVPSECYRLELMGRPLPQVQENLHALKKLPIWKDPLLVISL